MYLLFSWKNHIDKQLLGKCFSNEGFVKPKGGYGLQQVTPWKYILEPYPINILNSGLTLKFSIHTVTLYIIVTNIQVFNELMCDDTMLQCQVYLKIQGWVKLKVEFQVKINVIIYNQH